MTVFIRLGALALLTVLLANNMNAELRNLDGTVLKKIDNLSVIALWPKGTVGVNSEIKEKVKPYGKRFYNIHNPNITVYKPKKPNGVAVVLCPGGGYNYVASGVEGGPTGQKLNELGITVFVLKYRLPNTPGVNFKFPVPLLDALRAMQLVRYHAADFNINPDKIGVMGFSAGGHLASSAGTLFYKYNIGTDAVSKTSSRPDFMCLVYPVISTRKDIGNGCINALLRDKSDKQTLALLSNELNVTKKTPPAFIAQAKDDHTVNYHNSVVMHEALRLHGVPSVLKLYEKGGHGFGIGRKGTDSTKWIGDFIAWLKQMKIISIPKNNSKPDAGNGK